MASLTCRRRIAERRRQVSPSGGLHLWSNEQPGEDAYSEVVMAELAALREQFPAVRVDVDLRARGRP
jgi:hypothetical protein